MDGSPSGFSLGYEDLHSETRGCNNPGLKDTSPLGLKGLDGLIDEAVPENRTAHRGSPLLLDDL
ncbi:hypothetical protein SAMN02745166_00183 [Prosthecobacter debontii]|uniref:Uncharacterized protein n=1 Tax=Prosthecobacter debontii TaxID=48467 RepID=A0A1T4WGL7_9BACT|nr:hypothetical protein SAMN02745166_00183 [Prosthecobacter debontii]